MASRTNVWSTEDRIADAFNEPDIGRDGPLVRPNLGQNCPQVGCIGRRGCLTTQTVVHRVEVVADAAHMSHRPDQAKLVGHLRKLCVQFADLHARNLRRNWLIGSANRVRSEWLQIPCIKVTRTATQQDEDTRLLGCASTNPPSLIDTSGDHAG